MPRAMGVLLPLKSPSRSRSRSPLRDAQPVSLAPGATLRGPTPQQAVPLVAWQSQWAAFRNAVISHDHNRARAELRLLWDRAGEVSSHLSGSDVASTFEQARHVDHAIRERSSLWPGCGTAYYIGCSARTPEQRWRMETDRPHYKHWRKMIVLVQGSADECRAVESLAIARHRDQILCHNVASGGGGVSSGTHAAFVYLCLGFQRRRLAPPLIRRK